MKADIQIIIKYDGPLLDDKKMDVADLSPSLLALSDLVILTNRRFNGDRTGIKVNVKTSVDQKCFELLVHVTQTLLDQMTSLIREHKVIQAKEILEWIGIFSGGAAFAGVSLYKLLKLLNGKKVEDVKHFKDKKGLVQISIAFADKSKGAKNTIIVCPQVYKLYADYGTRKKALDVLKPLRKEGYEGIRFYKGETVYEEFAKEDVPGIEDCPEVISSNVVRSEIKTIVRIKKAAYEGKSKWTLVYGKAIEASIEDEDWLLKFQSNEILAPPTCSLEVKMIAEVVVDEDGEAMDEPIYRIIKVYKVVVPPEQLKLI